MTDDAAIAYAGHITATGFIYFLLLRGLLVFLFGERGARICLTNWRGDKRNGRER